MLISQQDSAEQEQGWHHVLPGAKGVQSLPVTVKLVLLQVNELQWTFLQKKSVILTCLMKM